MKQRNYHSSSSYAKLDITAKILNAISNRLVPAGNEYSVKKQRQQSLEKSQIKRRNGKFSEEMENQAKKWKIKRRNGKSSEEIEQERETLCDYVKRIGELQTEGQDIKQFVDIE